MRLFVKNDMFSKREAANSIFFRPNLENEEMVKVFEFLELERRRISIQRIKIFQGCLRNIPILSWSFRIRGFNSLFFLVPSPGVSGQRGVILTYWRYFLKRRKI